jgi:hypothetical protein
MDWGYGGGDLSFSPGSCLYAMCGKACGNARPDPLVFVNAVQLSHAVRKVGIRSFDDDVVVVGHLAVGMAAPVEPLANLLE